MISDEDSLSHPSAPPPPPLLPVSDKGLRLQALISRLTGKVNPILGPPDVDLSFSSREGFNVSMKAHRRVLADRSRFFQEKLDGGGNGARVTVDICDCDDVEVYVEVVAMMYCQEDLMKRLAGEDVTRVLKFLKVCVDITFDDGVDSCLGFLEAAPWSEDEEDTVASVLRSLHLHERAKMVLQRIYTEPSHLMKADGVLQPLLLGVLQAKNKDARGQMKSLLAGLIRDSIEQFNVFWETLYYLCQKCLNSLQLCLSDVANADVGQRAGLGVLIGDIAGDEIGREADNLQWLVEMLISGKMADKFVTLWADQKELASTCSKAPYIHRLEINRITAQLCVALGQRQVLVSSDAKYSLLQTWLDVLYEDYHLIRKARWAFDNRAVEDGLNEIILTLSLAQQQEILLRWFERFLDKGDDCPNILKAFKVWWRRAFIRHHTEEHSQLQITASDNPM